MSDVIVNGVRYVPAHTGAWTKVVDDDGNYDVPDSDRQVLVFLNGDRTVYDPRPADQGHGIRLGWWDEGKGCFRADGRMHAPVTHWMDLPSAPASGEVPQ